MAQTPPKILITLSEEIIESVDDYRYNNRIPSRSEAIRKLLKEALKKYEKKSKSDDRAVQPLNISPPASLKIIGEPMRRLIAPLSLRVGVFVFVITVCNL